MKPARPADWRLIVLLTALLGLVASLLLPWLAVRPNRISSGVGYRLAGLVPAWAFGAQLALLALLVGLVVLALVCVRPAGRWARPLLSVLALAGVLLPLLGLVAGARALAGSLAPAGRISLGSGFWLAQLAAAGGLGGLARSGLPGSRWLKSAGLALFAGLAAVLLASGALADLALVKEFAARQAVILGELARHVGYALLPTAAAFALCLPLGRLAVGRKALERPLFFAANLVQVIPTLALIGLLIGPLAALGRLWPASGIRGVGWAPAVIALFLYALLPLLANVRAGFAMVDPAALDVARALGLGPWRVFWMVELPLAAAALLAGFRTALAQNMGNAVLAGLVGAGGLGSLLFLGLAQAAPDLVLVTVLLLAGAAYALDRLLAAAEGRLAARFQ